MGKRYEMGHARELNGSEQRVLSGVAATKIVIDCFHIMGHMGKAVDQVRKREHRSLREAGEDTLVGSKYLWLYTRENFAVQAPLATLKVGTLKTARA